MSASVMTKPIPLALLAAALAWVKVAQVDGLLVEALNRGLRA
jgi:hypothetical protein